MSKRNRDTLRQQVVSELAKQNRLMTVRELAQATHASLASTKYVVSCLVTDSVIKSDRRTPEPSYGISTLTARDLLSQRWNGDLAL